MTNAKEFFLSKKWWGFLLRSETLEKEIVWEESNFFFGHLKFKMILQYPSIIVKWAAGKTNLRCRGKIRTGDNNLLTEL